MMNPITRAQLQEFSTQNSVDQYDESKRFEHFCAYCMLSLNHNDEFDTLDVIVGGGNDLGCDAVGIIINGTLVTSVDEAADIIQTAKYLDVEFVFVQSTTSSEFDGGRILTLLTNIRDDIFTKKTDLPKNDDLREKIDIIAKIYYAARLLTKGNPLLKIYYCTTGNWKLDQHLVGLIEQQKACYVDTNMFSDVIIDMIDAARLQDAYRNSKKSISKSILFERRTTIPTISGTHSAYIGILPISEFVKLIRDDSENIIKTIFYDNIRDFQQDTDVNKGRTPM